MTRLHWNFARQRWWNVPSAMVCVIAMAGCLQALWWRADLLQRREILTGRTRDVESMDNTRARPVVIAISPVLRKVFEEMHYPWDDMLESLKHATQPGVDLLDFEPDSGEVLRVQIKGTSDNVQHVFDFLSALQKDASWSSVQLVSQTQTQDAARSGVSASTSQPLPISLSRSIAFSLIAQWNRS